MTNDEGQMTKEIRSLKSEGLCPARYQLLTNDYQRTRKRKSKIRNYQPSTINYQLTYGQDSSSRHHYSDRV
jgi:hypothetical protein